MGETWFTVAAQIVNFLLLVWLLKYFLYGPIINMMEERQERIERREQEAEQQRERAEQEEDKYRAQLQQLQNQREQLIEDAEQKAEERRQELLEEVREEVDEAEQRWHRAIQRDREMFLRDLRQKVADETLSVTRQVLDDLADAELERMIIRSFIDRLDEVEDDQWDEMIAGARSEEDGLVVQTTFDIPAELQKDLSATIREHAGEGISISYRRAEELIGGIQIRSSGLKIAWSIDDYLESVRDSLERMIDEEVGAGAG